MLKVLRQKRSPYSESNGAAAVEFALILPLFFLLIFALIDFGRMFFVQVSITSASREGVRLSSLYSAGIPDIQSVVTLVNSSAPTAATISQLTSGATLTVTQTSCNLTSTTENTTVLVATTFRWLLPVGLVSFIAPGSPLARTLTLSSNGVMRCVG